MPRHRALAALLVLLLLPAGCLFLQLGRRLRPQRALCGPRRDRFVLATDLQAFRLAPASLCYLCRHPSANCDGLCCGNTVTCVRATCRQ
jgi:hypothetical protein